jgi:hypothetical protein
MNEKELFLNVYSISVNNIIEPPVIAMGFHNAAG